LVRLSLIEGKQLTSISKTGKEDIMKPGYKSLRLNAIVLVLAAAAIVWTAWPARQVQAIQDSEDFPSPFGLARGQTARLTLFNSGDTAVEDPDYKFVNGHGVILAEFPTETVIPPGQFRYFDFDLPNPPPGTLDFFGRVQLRVAVNSIGNPDEKDLRASVEVFDNTTGKTGFIIQVRPGPQ